MDLNCHYSTLLSFNLNKSLDNWACRTEIQMDLFIQIGTGPPKIKKRSKNGHNANYRLKIQPHPTGFVFVNLVSYVVE